MAQKANPRGHSPTSQDRNKRRAAHALTGRSNRQETEGLQFLDQTSVAYELAFLLPSLWGGYCDKQIVRPGIHKGLVIAFF